VSDDGPDGLDALLSRLELLVEQLDQQDEPLREQVFELLDGIDALHRLALGRLGARLGPGEVAAHRTDPAIAWLFDAYAVGVDERDTAVAALEPLTPYLESHGGSVEVLDVSGGVVRVRMGGSCSGCTSSAVTLQEGVEEALREGFPGFLRLEAEEDDAAPHPPPGATLLEITPVRR
jgi:Fe-S cluster biogenesis protein NfuA